MKIKIGLACLLLLSGCSFDFKKISLDQNINNGAVLGAALGAVGVFCVTKMLTDNMLLAGGLAAAGAVGCGLLGQQYASNSTTTSVAEKAMNDTAEKTTSADTK